MKLSTLVKFINAIKTVSNKVLPYSFQDFLSRKLGNGTYLSQVEFHLVDHCNLNCAHCNHFTPLAPENFCKIEEILEDFKKLKKIFDNIGKIFVVGGEPLLHPELLSLFKPLREIYPKSEIIIITNGILLNKQNDDFFNTLKKYNIAISMTHYPIKVDYEGWINKFNGIGIKAYYFSLDRNKMRKQNLNPKGTNDKNIAFSKCHEKNCHFVRDGKLYVCTPTPNIIFLNNYFNFNFEVKKTDYIDLNKIKSASYINAKFKKPIDFCKYCNDKEIEFDTYKTSKKELSEWVKL